MSHAQFNWERYIFSDGKQFGVSDATTLPSNDLTIVVLAGKTGELYLRDVMNITSMRFLKYHLAQAKTNEEFYKKFAYCGARLGQTMRIRVPGNLPRFRFGSSPDE